MMTQAHEIDDSESVIKDIKRDTELWWMWRLLHGTK